MSSICGGCGVEFDKISAHIRQSSCEYPELSDFQKDVCVGLLMGDGHIDMRSKNARFRCNMISRDYLSWLDESVFTNLGQGVNLMQTAEKEADRDRDIDNFSSNPDNYSDIYYWDTISHPYFTELNSWYDSGEKVWPENLEMSPTIMKNWYVSDGSLTGHKRNIRFCLSNEADNKNKINKYFCGLGVDVNWIESKRDDGSKKTDIQFNLEDSRKLLNYMGEPLPGFDYKWDIKRMNQ